MKLPHLRILRLRGVPGSALPELLTWLPDLNTLDAEYIGSGISKMPTRPLPVLRDLTIRTMSMQIDGPQQLWSWICGLVAHPQAVDSFNLSTFSVQGRISIPGRFILNIAQLHGRTLRVWRAETAQMTLEDVRYICTMFSALEELVCCVASTDSVS
jgi:hypothetical protein